jgi:hypothetical protein
LVVSAIGGEATLRCPSVWRRARCCAGVVADVAVSADRSGGAELVGSVALLSSVTRSVSPDDEALVATAGDLGGVAAWEDCVRCDSFVSGGAGGFTIEEIVTNRNVHATPAANAAITLVHGRGAILGAETMCESCGGPPNVEDMGRS